MSEFGVALDAPWEYGNRALLLAPMVRINTLPFRLLAAEHGADIVYSEELIDHSIKACRRSENASGRIEFRRNDDSKKLIFSTVPHERVAFQMGTASGPSALEAARVVVDDVRAIDVNMGCPEKFSTHGGMGSALLSQPEKVRDILRTLVSNLGAKPVTCKIRLLDDPHKTLQLARLIWDTGVAALAVHVRRIPDRPRFWSQWDQYKLLREHRPLSQPLILNGDVFRPEDITRAFDLTSADALMLARGAMWNPALFRRAEDALVPHSDLLVRYVEIAEEHNNHFGNTKYVALQMLDGCGKTNVFRTIQQAREYSDLRKAVETMIDCPPFDRPPRVHLHQQPAPDLPHAAALDINSWRDIPSHCTAAIAARGSKSATGLKRKYLDLGSNVDTEKKERDRGN